MAFTSRTRWCVESLLDNSVWSRGFKTKPCLSSHSCMSLFRKQMEKGFIRENNQLINHFNTVCCYVFFLINVRLLLSSCGCGLFHFRCWLRSSSTLRDNWSETCVMMLPFDFVLMIQKDKSNKWHQAQRILHLNAASKWIVVAQRAGENVPVFQLYGLWDSHCPESCVIIHQNSSRNRL